MARGAVILVRAVGIGIVPVSALLGPFRAACVDLAAIELRPLFGIAQDRVGRRDGLELFLGGLVSRVEVGMQFFRKLPVGLANIVLRRVFLQTENFVRVLAHIPLL